MLRALLTSLTDRGDEFIKTMNLYKRCPFCAEKILKKASFCKHCRRVVKYFRFRRSLKFLVLIGLVLMIAFNLDFIQKKSRIMKDNIDGFITATGDFQHSLERVGEGLNALQEREPFTLPKDLNEQLFGVYE